MNTSTRPEASSSATLDHSSDPRFTQYYADQSVTEANRRRLEGIRDTVLRVAGEHGRSRALAVADIGCGPGPLCQLWAERGHTVHGIDVNRDLVTIARERATEAGLEIDYRVGTATELPWADGSMDVCLAPELLEHVPEWQACIDEFVRVLRPGGILFLNTTNWLCPKQLEFSLPAYSWYPAPLKRYFERLARTTRPELAGYATYPAVNWFSFYSLRRALSRRGMRCYDRFDTAPPATSVTGGIARALLTRVPPVRLLGHMLTPYTRIVAVKR